MGAAVVAFAAGGADALADQATPTLPVSDYPRLWWDNTTSTLTSPVRWDEQDWFDFSAASLAVVGTAAFLDRPIRNWAQDHRGSSWENAANKFEPLGSTASFAVIGAFYLDGWIADNPQAENTAVDAVSASIVAGGIITPALKELAGRSRPSAHKGRYHFRPFSNGASFPSGHATQAFAVASVVAEHYNDNLLVQCIAYTAAGLVGVARIDHNAHFASDVLAGALIGTTVGRASVRFGDDHRRKWAGKPVALEPWFDGKSDGLRLSIDF